MLMTGASGAASGGRVAAIFSSNNDRNNTLANDAPVARRFRRIKRRRTLRRSGARADGLSSIRAGRLSASAH